MPERMPRCTFAEIIRYLREPADLSNPAYGEKASQAEIDKFSEELTSQQLEIVAKVKELASNPDNGPIEIMDAINTEFQRDFGIGDIQSYMDR